MPLRLVIENATKRALRRLIAADNMTQKENAKMETELAIAQAMIRAGRPHPW